MTQIIQLIFGNTAPTTSAREFGAVKSVWSAAAAVLARYEFPVFSVTGTEKSERWRVSIDVSDVLDFLEACEMCDSGQDNGPLNQRMMEQHSLGRGLLSSVLEMRLEGVEPGERPEIMALNVGRFLQRFFLTMNLAVPGSCHMYYCTYQAVPSAKPPRLDGDVLESAYEISLDRAWPAIQPIEFATTWTWLDRVFPYDLDIAREPVHVALFNLLRLCSLDRADPTGVLIVAQSLEAILSSGDEHIGAALKRRIHAVLGEPQTHKNWFRNFYKLRSGVAHGSTPLLRPNGLDLSEHPVVADYVLEQLVPLYQSVSVLLAVIQDLIGSEARGYRFPEHLTRLSI
jgi:hypothetical protein